MFRAFEVAILIYSSMNVRMPKWGSNASMDRLTCPGPDTFDDRVLVKQMMGSIKGYPTGLDVLIYYVSLLMSSKKVQTENPR